MAKRFSKRKVEVPTGPKKALGERGILIAGICCMGWSITQMSTTTLAVKDLGPQPTMTAQVNPPVDSFGRPLDHMPVGSIERKPEKPARSVFSIEGWVDRLFPGL